MQQIPKKKYVQIVCGICWIVFCIVLDQYTKYLAVSYLKNASAVSIIPNVFELYYLENHGAAFGILQGQKTFFVIMTTVALVVLIYLFFRIPKERRYFSIRLILILLISGAVGNFIDRCTHDYVIDFFYFKLIDFPVFNVADIFVTTAAVLLILVFTFYYKEKDIDIIMEQLIFWKKKEKS